MAGEGLRYEFVEPKWTFTSGADTAPREYLTAELEGITADLAALAGTVTEAQPVTPQEDVGALAQQVLAVLPETTLAPASEDTDLWAIARYRASPAQDWTYADPARASRLDDVDPPALDIISDTIPQDHQHRVSFTLRVESETFGSVAAGQFSAARVGAGGREKPIETRRKRMKRTMTFP